MENTKNLSTWFSRGGLRGTYWSLTGGAWENILEMLFKAIRGKHYMLPKPNKLYMALRNRKMDWSLPAMLRTFWPASKSLFGMRLQKDLLETVLETKPTDTPLPPEKLIWWDTNDRIHWITDLHNYEESVNNLGATGDSVLASQCILALILGLWER